MPISQQQIDEWAESPVAEYLIGLLKKKLDTVFKQRGECFFPGEATRTQEIRSNLMGEESALDEIIVALESKDLSQLEEEDEQIRDSPVRRPGIGEAGNA